MNMVIKDSKGVHLEYDNNVSRTVAIGNLSLLFSISCRLSLFLVKTRIDRLVSKLSYFK